MGHQGTVLGCVPLQDSSMGVEQKGTAEWRETEGEFAGAAMGFGGYLEDLARPNSPTAVYIQEDPSICRGLAW